MILPTSVEFFLPNFSKSSEKIEKTAVELTTDLAKKEVLKFLPIRIRQHLQLCSNCSNLKRLDSTTPYQLETCSVGKNLIELDFFGCSWSFGGKGKVTLRFGGGLRKELDLKIPKEESMRRILKFYLTRKGTIVKKLWIKDQESVKLLASMGVFNKFNVSNQEGVLLENLEDLDDFTLSKITWKLVDPRC
ncbi:SKN-1 Dependent Zygotic transcript [Caenorhabditis elegans]|uniref:SKN-1 Dependent Zygotic transcript n=1 Tax=Caenorhabditis elegans TaxID=6239 RepID=Q9N4U8_CAEEL|nr:SKN-1 Dependent Zygotic transcript [Caenorhabditis elegans]CCD64716.2 SKN-1 Dependent Zygotic transcript [Caenorhabditis elegans]